MAKKVYAIIKGYDNKNNKEVNSVIVNTWAECLKLVKGVKGAKYKSFELIDDAKAYLKAGEKSQKKSDGNYPKDAMHIYVDGSYSISNERYSYCFVVVKDDIVRYIESNSEKEDKSLRTRQVKGELEASYKAALYAFNNNEKRVVIFHDYEGVRSHATGEWNRNEKSSEEYYDNMQEVMKKGLDIIFVKVDSHTGDFFNDLADEKCKECIEITSSNAVLSYLKTNKIYVADENIKKQIESITNDTVFDNIIVVSDKDSAEKIIESTEKEKEDTYSQILSLYKEDKVKAQRMIKKMKSKEKEEFIFYLLSEKKYIE
ncbi:ribonuclease H family protein [Clostridium sp. BJN0001]|uniref:ribonuclease H family protein n=1 Tax=Clostridium sp. BJN0001 TaxID=2930219 RepID=UPI001FD387B9|nr:ribonuclease H family protein [Clostridium sp. BJN0001]